MEAVILAGGKGTRLHPYTAEIPKALVTVGDKPIIEILLRRMQRCGVRKAHLAVNHLAHLIMAVLNNGEHLGLEIVYSHEEQPLSTVGPITLIKNLPEHFLVANGDILTALDFKELFEHHLHSRAVLTVATHRRTHTVDYGVLEVGADGTVTGFREKPTYSFTVSMGVYVFSRKILSLVPTGQRFGFDDLMFTLLKHKERINLFPFDGYWLDIGRPEDYEQANADLEKVRRLYE
jgi:NDP-sugar pyrophosphorylase family protein